VSALLALTAPAAANPFAGEPDGPPAAGDEPGSSGAVRGAGTLAVVIDDGGALLITLVGAALFWSAW
jgi:hypothetical protein